MRPLELRLRDFKSYFGKETVFDLRGRRLIGIVGPIGSGKSSILDAVAFALYGKAPNTKGTTPLIHQRADGAAVALRFEADGSVWEVVRALRRKGQGQHVLYRFDADGPDAEPTEKVTMKAEVDRRIVELLGLDFDAFTKSVLLAQGRFAEFLDSGPADRDRVLKGVFGHDRLDVMRAEAKERAGAAELEAERLAVRLEEVERLTVRLAQDRVRLGALDVRLEQLRKLEPRVVDLDTAIDVAERSLARLDERLAELDALAERLPDATQTGALLDEARSIHTSHDAMQTAVADAQAAVDAAEASAAEAEQQRDTFDSATVLLASHGERAGSHRNAVADAQASAQRLEEAREASAESQRALILAHAEMEAAEKEQLEAADALGKATEEAHRVQHADMAASLVATLSVGEPCPVCAQSVPAIPTVSVQADLDVAETAVREAAAALADAQQRVARTGAAVAAATEGVTGGEHRLEQALSDHELASQRVADSARIVEKMESDLEGLLGPGDPTTLIDELRERLSRTAAVLLAARTTLDDARRRLAEAQSGADHLMAQVDTVRVRLAEISAQLGEPLTASGTDPDTVQTMLSHVRTVWTDRRSAIRSEREETHAAMEVAIASKAQLMVDNDIGSSFSQEMSAAAAEAAVLHRDIDDATKRLAETETMVERHQQLVTTAEAFRRVSSDLTDSRFVRYLLDDERARLAELGSEHLQSLSNGRYRFTEDGVFDIVDLTAADAIRSAESLSGGETFLASLALALALAEMVARQGGRLDAFFLDEGFGTLDPEHLDLAMEGIERLVASSESRFVAVVSHVPELRQRIEDQIRLDRDPVTGDTRVVQA